MLRHVLKTLLKQCLVTSCTLAARLKAMLHRSARLKAMHHRAQRFVVQRLEALLRSLGEPHTKQGIEVEGGSVKEHKW